MSRDEMRQKATGWEKRSGGERSGSVNPEQSYASYPQSHLILLELISNHLNTLGILQPLKRPLTDLHPRP